MTTAADKPPASAGSSRRSLRRATYPPLLHHSLGHDPWVGSRAPSSTRITRPQRYTDPSAICVRRRWPSRVTVGVELLFPATIADFHCCALFMSRACCHHYPGGIAGCVSRSLHRRRRPSPLLWRVGSHIDCFEACSMFTHVAARTVRCPPIGVFSRSASDHSSPPDPPRVLPAGARVCRPGFPPGRTVHLDKAHIKIPMNDAESMPPDTAVQTSRCANCQCLRSDQREDLKMNAQASSLPGGKRNLAPSAAVSRTADLYVPWRIPR